MAASPSPSSSARALAAGEDPYQVAVTAQRLELRVLGQTKEACHPVVHAGLRCRGW